MRLIKPLCYSSIILFYSCANQATPTGGPKDSEAPQIIESIPENRSTHFAEKEITIKFDEYAKLNNVSQILVSPPFKEKPEFKFKKKSLFISINDTLKDSTTYTINFGEAIIDITEGNPLRNFQYVFSTGGYVDSMEISGTVVRASDLEPQEDILVM